MIMVVFLVTLAVLLWPPSVGERLDRRLGRGGAPPRRSGRRSWRSGVGWRSGAGWRSPAAPSSAVVLRVMEDLATQVRAGVDPNRAWEMAWQLASSDRGSAAFGASAPGAAGGSVVAEAWLLPGERPVDAALRLARSPGADPSMVALAAAWRLSSEIGAPLTEVLSSVAEGIRQDAEIEGEIQAELAAPRATARLLAVLPLAGLGLGQLIGARPFMVLTTTTVGRWCAAGGLALAWAGHLWTRRLVIRTERLL